MKAENLQDAMIQPEGRLPGSDCFSSLCSTPEGLDNKLFAVFFVFFFSGI